MGREYLEGRQFDVATMSEADRRSLARDLFVHASVKTPGSVVAQGAVIADICLRTGITDPSVLGDILVSDRSTVWNIMYDADNAHKSAGNGPSRITEEKTAQVIRASFRFAEDLLVLEPSEISMISNVYYRQLRKREGPFAKWPKDLDPDEVEYRFQDSVRLRLNEVHERNAKEHGYAWQRKTWSVGPDAVNLFGKSLDSA